MLKYRKLSGHYVAEPVDRILGMVSADCIARVVFDHNKNNQAWMATWAELER